MSGTVVSKLHDMKDLIVNLIYAVLEKEKLLVGEWGLGEVTEVVSNKMLKVKVNGSDIPTNTPCNPDVTFSPGDHVWVHFVNRDKKSRFVPYKRGV